MQAASARVPAVHAMRVAPARRAAGVHVFDYTYIPRVSTGPKNDLYPAYLGY